METYEINISEFIESLFEKTEKIQRTKDLEKWDAMSYSEKETEIRYLADRHKKLWIGYHLLSIVAKYIHLLAPVVLFFGFTITTISAAIGIFLTFKLISRIFTRASHSNSIEYRQFHYILINGEIQ